jgi:hypothetical protein
MSETPQSTTAPQKVDRTDAEWRAALTPEQYQVLRQKGTERPFTGALTENHETGNYHCAGSNRHTAGQSTGFVRPDAEDLSFGQKRCPRTQIPDAHFSWRQSPPQLRRPGNGLRRNQKHERAIGCSVRPLSGCSSSAQTPQRLLRQTPAHPGLMLP